MKLLHILAFAVGGSLIALLAMLIIKAQASQQGEAPGLRHGRLSPCSIKPNCVSSEAEEPADKRVAPLAFDGSAAEAWQRLQAAIRAQGGELVRVDETYLAATYRSRLFGFVDDLEARLDPEGRQIHLRSGSRVGHSDLGANRTRVTRLRELFERR